MMSRASAKPARLLRKVTQVEAVRGDDAQWWDRLPVYTLTFADPGERMPCRIECGDVVKVVVPNYKPKSYSMSRQGDGEFDITYKYYPGGKCSGYLESLGIGDEIQCFAKGGKRRNGGGTHIGMVAFGVGITEVLPVAAAQLTHADVRKVKLIWATKTFGDCFWLDELERLKADGRFEVVHVLSREDKDGCRRGRVTPELLKEELDEAWGVGSAVDRANVRLISIGTKAMMRDFNDMVYADLDYKYAANRLLED